MADYHDQKIIDKLVTARIALLLKHPFFGNLATRLKLVNADDWCPTAGTDGRHFFYNTKFIDSLTPKESEFLFGHEVLHNVFEHMLVRIGDRDPQLWNIAADYAVNQILKDSNIGDMPKGKKGENKGFQDDKYKDWASERIYDDLFKQAKKNGKKMLEKLGELMDDHQEWGKGDGEGQGKGGKDGKKGGKPVYTKEELKKIRDEIKESMMGAAQAAGAGKVPAEIERMIKELTEPKMNWREILRQQIQSTIKNDYTFQRPSRKGWHTGAVLPGINYDETIDICIAIDMSGSIGNEQGADFLGEVQGIMSEYQDYNIKVWCFDTKVYNEQDFTADNGTDLNQYQLMGGGGTDFNANWEYMKEQDIVPKRFIMFTDGYPWDSWGDESYCDTVFVIHGHHDKNLQAPFGLTCHYEEAR